MRLSQRITAGLLGILTVLALSGAVLAATPQTIVIDGVNDFLPGNNIDPDLADTDPAHPPLELENLYVTNDAVNLFIGFKKSAAPYGTTQLGIAIDVDGPDGGTADPWGRAIEWSLAANKPDYMFYVNLDNNWQAAYEWNGAAWAGIGASGPGALGWVAGTDFAELGVLLATLGVAATDAINVEAWLTQDAGTKGPLDAFANDGVQLSLPGGTTWDTPVPIPMFDYHAYTVQAAVDPDPPVVTGVEPGSQPIANLIDVVFNEPVDLTTSENTANYSVAGKTVNSAVRDVGNPSRVRLTLDTSFTGSATLQSVLVSSVEDVAGNPIVEDGVDNAGCFGVKEVIFRGKFGPFIDNLGTPPPYEFSVEGGKSPLTWGTIGDTGLMVDSGVDDIYEYTTLMMYDGDCGGGTASELFEWKFAYDGTTYEPLASNRQHTLDLANGATDILEFWWADEDPSQFTTHDIDVEFFVDMNLSSYIPGDVVTINGSTLPLSFDVPSLNALADDGVDPDETAGDGVFSARITFPTGSKKDVTYKFLMNDIYECDGQSDRYVFLNDELFDTVGGTFGPLTLPTVKYDFCNTIWRPVEVVFSVDFNNTGWQHIQPSDVVGVNGTPDNAEPPVFDWSVPSLNDMADDGIAPDLEAGDKIYTVSVVFTDTSSQNVEYKYLHNDQYECTDVGNRTFSIDPDNFDASGNPQILPVDIFQRCGGLSGVPELATGLLLEQNTPNPFNPSTEIRYAVQRAGSGSLRIFNIRGESVRALRQGEFAAGPGMAVWDGRADSGAQVGSGVYFYRLDVGGVALTRQMVLLK